MVLVVGPVAGAATGQTDRGDTPTDEATELMVERLELENEKLRQEINTLQSERSGWGRVLASLTLIGAVVAASATAVGVIRQWREANRQREREAAQRLEEREADRRQREREAAQRLEEREADRRQREREAAQRLEERMADVVTNLGSGNEALQASSAASLLAFLMPEKPAGAPLDERYPLEDSVRRTVWLVLANLKLNHASPVQQQLVKVFEQALRIHFPAIREEAGTLLDLARAELARIDLSGLNLRDIDIAFANLAGAKLNGANLYRVRGYRVNLSGARLSVLRKDDEPPVAANLGEARLRNAIAPDAHFHEARLNSARLEQADLRRAEFQGAHLQAAHLNGADLRGATFDGAHVSDTDFRGASLDHVALMSLRSTRRNKKGVKSWQRAKFDPKHLAVLEGRQEIP
jgi:uncharacterized protein YjbI with pentapeptide repeats